MIMEQSTIREKIEKLLNQDGISYIESFKINFKTPKQNNIGGEMIMNPVFLKEFARLICEAMTGSKEKNTCSYRCGRDMGDGASCDHEGYAKRIDEEKQKAQEILKALE